jgi:hypothetical protein
MVLPLWLFPLFVGPGALFFGSIENAAADGKRLRAIDASGFANRMRARGSKTA